MKNKVFTKSDKFRSEYSCSIVRVGELEDIPNSDFLAKTLVFGTQIVVRKDMVKSGDIMIYAANETQINEKFLSVNNLFDISCREKNANAEEVNKIYDEYLPIKENADKIKAEAKRCKSIIDSCTTKASKLNRKIDKLNKKLSTLEEGCAEYTSISDEISKLRKEADMATQKAVSKTTTYSNLKKQIEDIVSTGADIIAEVKKHCGYMNKYGRVRCIKLKETPSFGMLLAPQSLFNFDSSITMEDIESYIGEEFDTINEELFVKAYIPPVVETNKRGRNHKLQSKVSRFDRIVENEFFFHYDTSQLEKDIHYFKPEDIVSISDKLHGTSVIIGKLRVREPIKLPLYKRLFNKFVDTTGLFKDLRITDSNIVYGPIYSSRTVIKNRYINENVGKGFFKQDIWTEYGDIIYPYLDEGMTVYGEICGYLTGSETMIQKFYDYGCNVGENFLMIYRISTHNEDGEVFEWEIPDVAAWTNSLVERMKECNDDNYKRIHPIDILYHGELGDLYPDIETDSRWHENVLERMKNDKETLGMEEPEPLCTHYPESPREGVVLRKYSDSVLRAEKLKTVAFKFKEAVMYDAGEVDIEAADNYGETEETNDEEEKYL